MYFYKEFKVFRILFAIKKWGIKIITENGSYGFNIDRIGFDIYRGFVEKCYYFGRDK